MDLQEYKKCLSEIESGKLATLKNLIHHYQNIIILGNGGSNAIALHIAEDYHKMLGIKAIAFGDTPRMSCYTNDYGWDNAYKMFLEHFATDDTLVILISSSGNSKNILNCAKYCVDNSIDIITLSGHSDKNKLKSNFGSHSKLHFWVDSKDYGIVECLHELILHSVI